jgi:hypothetical protein
VTLLNRLRPIHELLDLEAVFLMVDTESARSLLLAALTSGFRLARRPAQTLRLLLRYQRTLTFRKSAGFFVELVEAALHCLKAAILRLALALGLLFLFIRSPNRVPPLSRFWSA